MNKRYYICIDNRCSLSYHLQEPDDLTYIIELEGELSTITQYVECMQAAVDEAIKLMAGRANLFSSKPSNPSEIN